jgi:hypothetical protein
MFRASLRPLSGGQTAFHCLCFPVLAVDVVVLESREPQQLQSGQKTIGSETQSGRLMMGVKTPETC